MTSANLAVLVADKPNSRVAKVAFGLRSRGWEAVLLHRHPLHGDAAYFSEVHRYGDADGALRLASGFRPRLFHLFSMDADETCAAFFHARPGPLVFDPYDTAEGIAYAWSKQVAPLQRAMLEAADGVCARDLRLRWLARAKGYRYRRHHLHLDCTWDFPLEPRRRNDGEIHLVAAGYILSEKLDQQEHAYLRVARLLADQGIHFHIYPHPMQAAAFGHFFSEHEALARETSCFHLHQPLPFDALLTALQDYDLGAAFNGGELFGEVSRDYDPAYNRHTAGSRVFDYLDAGLPVLDNARVFRFRYHLLARHGAGMNASLELLQEAGPRLRAFLDSGAAEGARRARADYAIDRRIDGLIAFYESL